MNKRFSSWPTMAWFFLLFSLVFDTACFQGGLPATDDTNIRKGKNKELAGGKEQTSLDTTNGQDPSKNPYAGAGKASEPADISGAWLTRCDIVELGAALGKNTDKILCSAHRQSGEKFAGAVNFEFYDKEGRVVLPVTKRDLALASFYNVEYDLPNEVAKDYAWIDASLNPSSKKLPLDYGIMNLTSGSVKGVSAFIPSGNIPSADAFSNKKPDEAVCTADGTVLRSFTAAGICNFINIGKIVGLNNIYCDMDGRPIDVSNSKGIDLMKGCFELVTEGFITGSDRYLYKGTTGCAVALFRSDQKGGDVGFLTFSKDQIKNKVLKPDDLTFEKIRSHIERRKCR